MPILLGQALFDEIQGISRSIRIPPQDPGGLDAGSRCCCCILFRDGRRYRFCLDLPAHPNNGHSSDEALHKGGAWSERGLCPGLPGLAWCGLLRGHALCLFGNQPHRRPLRVHVRLHHHRLIHTDGIKCARILDNQLHPGRRQLISSYRAWLAEPGRQQQHAPDKQQPG